uniref:Uncharacterized protein n=1 Tax=Arundo donax TaxID=35708 RepID=A0A0A9CFS2_ARUDO
MLSTPTSTFSNFFLKEHRVRRLAARANKNEKCDVVGSKFGRARHSGSCRQPSVARSAQALLVLTFSLDLAVSTRLELAFFFIVRCFFKE